MNRRQYMRELSLYLRRLSADDREDAMRFYEEMFDDANIGEKDTVPDSFDSPKAVALEILAEYNLRDNKVDTEKGKRSNRNNTLLIIILAILSAPISIPFAIAVLGIFISIIVSIFLLLVIPVVIIVAGISIMLAVSGLSFSTYAFLAGLVLIAIGAGVLIFEAAVLLFSWLANWISGRVKGGN